MSEIDPSKIKLATQDNVDIYEQGVDRVLEALGHPEALVTDLSQVFDFICPFNVLDEVRVFTDLLSLMGREVSGVELIWELGKELMEKE